MYGQIITFLFVLLIIYYVVMILLDIHKAKAIKASEQEKNPEEEIDISDEASTFQPILITRDDPKKAQSSESETENVVGESTEQSESKDYHLTNTNESGQDNKESSVDKPSSPAENPSHASDTPATQTIIPSDSDDNKPEPEDLEEKRNPTPFKREGYREPVMTGALPIETIIQQVDEYAETGKGPLGEIIFECRSAHF